MSALDGLRHRLHVMLHGERYAHDVERELRFHAELDALARSSEGLNRVDAELAARRTLGNATYYREEVRRMTLQRFVDHARQDFAYAWRGLRREPLFAAMVIATIALGVGANTALFAVLDRIFLQSPAGVASPSDVRRLYIDARDDGATRMIYDSYPYPQFRAIRAAVDSSIPLAAYTEPNSTSLVRGDLRIPVRQSRVTTEYFSSLGVRPQRGRFFIDEENRIETPTPVAVLSDAAWRRIFDGAPAILGRTISIDFRPFTVVGIAAPGFTGADLDAVDVWLPANTYPARRADRVWYETFQSSFRIVARVTNPGTERHVLDAGGIAYRSVRMKGFGFDTTANLRSGPIIRSIGPAKLQQEIVIATRVAGVAGIILIIACANVANLLLVRATRRRREIAVRRALGASASRLFAQLVTESLLLSAIASGATVLVAAYGATALRRLLLPSVQWSRSAIDWRATLFSIGVALVVGIIAALAPATHAPKQYLTERLKSGGRDGAVDRSRMRATLLSLQAALSVVLVIGATLFLRSLGNVRGIDLGVDPTSSAYALPLFETTDFPPAVLGAGLEEVATRLREAPGIDAIATASTPPMRGYSAGSLFLPDRDSTPRLGRDGFPAYVSVSPSFFRASGTSILEGRDFTASDRSNNTTVVIVNKTMARVFWPGRSALGQCLIVGQRTNPCSLVVGIVADAHRMNVIETPAMQYYLPLPSSGKGAEVLVLRNASGASSRVTKLVGDELKRQFPTMTTPRVRSLADAIESEFRPWKLGAKLFTAFGVLAVLVAAVGVFSVVSYNVTQRAHEMGVRIALGAQTGDMLSLVLGGSIRSVSIGIGVGMVIALVLGRLIESLLFDVSARDPWAFAAATVILCVIAIAASTAPAFRAARTDPMQALRAD